MKIRLLYRNDVGKLETIDIYNERVPRPIMPRVGEKYIISGNQYRVIDIHHIIPSGDIMIHLIRHPNSEQAE